MTRRKVLSPFSFYGGKDRMAPLICDLLDYKHTDLYIEPFGGACRVLLNKPRHAQEIYNDFGYGCEFSYKSRVMRTNEPLKTLKAPYMVRNPMKWGFFGLIE